MKWEKTGRTARLDGGSTTYYESQDGRFKIESRKRAIPHANRSGSWMHTTYFLIDESGAEKEYYSLKDAKAAADMRQEEEPSDKKL